MVARRILVPPVRVRIFPRQHQNGSSFELPIFFVVPVGPHELFRVSGFFQWVGKMSEYSVIFAK